MLRYLVLACAMFCLVGCTSLAVKPNNGDMITATQSPQDVQISLIWPNGDLVSGPIVAIDGTSFPNSALAVTATGATGTAHLLNGQHAIRVQTAQKCWYCSGSVFNYDVTNNFAVSMPASVPTVQLNFNPDPGNAIDVPRNGTSTPLNFSVQISNTTQSFAINASGLPSGVSMAQASVSNGAAIATLGAATLGATATATGSTTATFTVKPTTQSTPNNSVQHKVQMIPFPGSFSFVQVPSFGASGPPPTPTSPDGKVTSTVSRTGMSRVWTYTIKVGSSTLAVTVANKTSGSVLSSLGGLQFCSVTGAPTTTAIVLSDLDESANPTGPANNTYNLKIIKIDGTTIRESGSMQVFTPTLVTPRVGFSPDCSIVAGWYGDQLAIQRDIAFTNGLTGVNGGSWTYSSTTPTSATPFDLTAKIVGTNIVINGPSTQTKTLSAPQ
jgi:hypothetical protein